MIVSREKIAIHFPEDVSDHLKKLLQKEDRLSREREHFWVVMLDTRNKVKLVELVSLGTLNTSLVHPREVFRRSVHYGVASIIIAHNHPSTDGEPSEEDLTLTRRLCEAGKLLGIEVLDHIILGNPTVSLKEKGLI